MRFAVFCAAAIVGGITAVSAQESAGSSAMPQPDEPTPAASIQTAPSSRTAQAMRAKLSDSDIATAPVKELRVTTRHAASIHGREFRYDATAGTLTLRDDQGKPIASLFYVGYTVPVDHGGAPRPLTFFFNGGPGSASLWLHMGSFGPVRVLTAAPDPAPSAPFRRVDNADSLLDKSDLVFLDAIGTGYSRALGDNRDDRFFGVDSDVDAFTRAVIRYITVNQRWNAAKFIFGESYGTPRACGLVYALGEKGVYCNGVTLLSSVLNYGMRNEAIDRQFVSLLPTYAAAAWYHNKINPRPPELEPFLREVRGYASSTYLLALDKGGGLTELETQSVAHKLAYYTGLSVEFVRENHLRVPLDRYRKELMRTEHRTIGRYDSRFVGIDADDGGDHTEFDAASAYITGPFVGALRDYLETDLGFRTDLEYRDSAGPETIRHWDWHHKAPGSEGPPAREPNMTLDLSAAMRRNPELHVLSLNGWYDMATPFFQTEYDLSHMYLDRALQPNLQLKYYPSGHMVYLNPQALTQMKADVAAFYDQAAPVRTAEPAR